MDVWIDHVIGWPVCGGMCVWTSSLVIYSNLSFVCDCVCALNGERFSVCIAIIYRNGDSEQWDEIIGDSLSPHIRTATQVVTCGMQFSTHITSDRYTYLYIFTCLYGGYCCCCCCCCGKKRWADRIKLNRSVIRNGDLCVCWQFVASAWRIRNTFDSISE